MADALHTPGVTSAAEARFDDAGLLAPGVSGLTSARTGVMFGPGSTALVTGTSSTSPMRYSVAAHHWVTSRGVVADGVYRGGAEADQLVDTGAAPGSGSRIDVVWVKQQDATSTITADGATAPLYGCTQGTPSGGTPAVPTIPVGAEELARVTVTSAATRTDGAGVTITQTARQTVARGARIPVRSSTEQTALVPFVGLEVYRLDTGQVQLCTAVAAGVGTFVTLYDPASSVPRGRVASVSVSTTGPSGIGATETLVDALTFPAQNGRRYRMFWDGPWLVNTAQVTAAFTVRVASGTSVTTAGAKSHERLVRSWAFGEFLDKQLVCEFLSGVTGQATVGVFVRAAVGAGTISIPGDTTNQRKLLIDDIGF